jgi:hypothetical protein
MSTTEELAGTARSTAAAVAGTVKDSGRDAFAAVRSHAGEAASRTAEAARAEAMSRAESAKDTLASEGERLAQSLRSAVDGGDTSIQARVMGQVADSVEDLVGTIRDKSFGELLSDVDGFARRNPGAFVAAAALAGFAVARFARASTPTSSLQAYADIEREGGAQYGSPRPTGTGYAGGSDYAGATASSTMGASGSATPSTMGSGSSGDSGLGVAERAARADEPGAEIPSLEREPSGDLSQP